MSTELNAEYWDELWTQGETKWDVGNVSLPLKNYIDSLQDPSIKILIPGCGNGYEGAYLWSKGFRNVHILDISEIPLKKFKQRLPEFPETQLIHGNFFEYHQSFDLILEQTFFCALSPDLRTKYAQHMHHLLVPGGKLAGLLFDFPLTETGPPYGGNREEYLMYFKDLFQILRLERAQDSILPREGRELFIELQKS